MRTVVKLGFGRGREYGDGKARVWRAREYVDGKVRVWRPRQ
jgi:hypothetical protein